MFQKERTLHPVHAQCKDFGLMAPMAAFHCSVHPPLHRPVISVMQSPKPFINVCVHAFAQMRLHCAGVGGALLLNHGGVTSIRPPRPRPPLPKYQPSTHSLNSYGTPHLV